MRHLIIAIALVACSQAQAQYDEYNQWNAQQNAWKSAADMFGQYARPQQYQQPEPQQPKQTNCTTYQRKNPFTGLIEFDTVCN